jgi:hypothetical protein
MKASVSVDVIDECVATTKGRRSCHDGGSAEGIVAQKGESQRRRETRTHVDLRLAWHGNN